MNRMARQGTLLLAEDDEVFAGALARALRRRGFDVVTATTASAAMDLARAAQPRFAVVDLKLGTDSGLALIPMLHMELPRMRILLLTGYASIATAVEAIKRGAHDYLAKPVGADAVVHALLDDGDGAAGQGSGEVAAPLPLRRLEWEHIQRTLAQCDGNISMTARRLGMHRRTLQRKLEKHPVHERSSAV